MFSGVTVSNLLIRESDFLKVDADVFEGVKSPANGMKVYFDENYKIEDLPEKLFAPILFATLSIRGNEKLVKLPNKLFSGATSVAEIGVILLSGKFENLQAELFDGLIGLEALFGVHIDIRGAKALSPLMFSGIKTGCKIDKITIESTFVTELPEKLFDGVECDTQRKNGCTIRIDQNSKLVTLPPRLFSGVSHVGPTFITGNSALETLPAKLFDGGAYTRGVITIIKNNKLANIERQDFKGATFSKQSLQSNIDSFQLELQASNVNCCGLEWLIDGTTTLDTYHKKGYPNGFKTGSKLICSTPSSLNGIDLLSASSGVWDPADVKENGMLICSCNDPKQLVQGLDDDGKPNCVDECSAGYVRRGKDGDENDACDQCRFDENGANPLALDKHCTTCKAGDTIGFPDTCTKCTNDYYLKASQGCTKECELDVNGNAHLGFRNVGSDKTGRICQACDDADNCNTCADDAKVCTECTNDNHLHNGECVKDCPSQLKLKQCNDTKTVRAASEKDSDYLWRFVPSGGKRDSTSNILTGSVCKETVAEDKTKPTTSLQLSPEVTHTRDSTLLLSVAFNDAGSATVTGMDFDDVAFTPNGQAQPADGVGRVLAKDAYLQVEFQKQGKVTIDLPADIALDESCNKNAAATSVSVTYDIDPPTVSITSFTTTDLADAVEITIADTLSPIEMDTTKLQDFFKLNALGSDDDALPTLVIGDTPCVETDTTTTVCTVTAEHSQTLVPYRFNLNPKAAADAAGNPSPLLESPAYHCPENVPVGANGKCIKFDLAVNENKRSRSGADFTNPADMTEYIVGESYRISPWELVEDATIVSDGDFDDITYTLADALDGWFVGTGTGEITGVFKEPSKEGGPVKMTLYAVDATGQRAKVEEYTFKVVSPPKFVLKSSNARRKTGDAFTNPKDIAANSNTFYAVGDTYKISPRTVLNTTEFSSVGGSLDTLVYGLAGTLPEDLFVKTTTGDILVTFTAADEGKTYSVNLDVIDGTERATLETMTMEVKYRDVKDPNNRAAFGPNKKVCEHGALVDDPATQFDKRYACDCRGLQFEGDNCEIPIKEPLNCKPGFALVDGKCEEFKLHVNDTKRVVQQQEGSATVYTDPTSMADTFYEVYKSYRVAAFEILSSTQPTAGNLSDITYTLGAGTPDNFFLSTTSGEIFWRFGEGDADKSFSITLNAVDKGGAVQPVETMKMKVKFNDIDVGTNGPNNNACNAESTKRIVDDVRFDGNFTCECRNGFGGLNCDVPVCLDGKVCDADLNICRQEKREVVVDGKCEACLFNSHPNDAQTNCVVDECNALESANICTCDLADLTKEDLWMINVACGGVDWTDTIASSSSLALPQYVSQLALTSVEPDQLPTLLRKVSALNPQDNATSSSSILSVIVAKDSLATVSNTVDETSASAVTLAMGIAGATDAATADASRAIALLPECSMGGFVPAADFDIPIGVCESSNGDGDPTTFVYNTSCGNVCPEGQFADFSDDSNSGACMMCERGGFYANTKGRVGHGSHCACTACKDGTFSAEPGATDPNEECQVCPSGTQSDTPAGYRACPCLPGFSRTDRFGECTPCDDLPGVECTGDARVLQKDFFWEFPTKELEVEYLEFTANLQLSFDYNRSLSRFNGTYPIAYACPTPGNCRGVTAGSASSCVEGTTGPLCAVCEDTHFRLNGACTACPQSKGLSTFALIVIVIIFAVAIVLVLRRNADDVPEIDDWEHPPVPKHKLERAYKVQFMTVVKIVLGYTQIKSLLIEVYTGVSWPRAYRSFTGGLQFLSSNPLSIVMPSCLSPSLTITAYSEFVIAAVTPLIVAPIIVIYYQIKTKILTSNDGSSEADADKLRAVCISTASFVYYLLYPTIAVASVRVLAECDSICRTDVVEGLDGSDCVGYLRADYSIPCGTSKHTGYKVGASFSFMLYSIVSPAVIAFLLYRGRHEDTKSNGSALMAGFSFYSKQFKAEFFFWETVDLYRKLLMTSMAVLVADGTSLQITFGIVFAIVGFVLQLVYNPYVYKHENRLAVASQAITLLALVVGILIRASEAEVAGTMKTANINSIVAGAYLITSGLVLYCWVLVLFILFKYFKNETTGSNSKTLGGDEKSSSIFSSSLSGTELNMIHGRSSNFAGSKAASATASTTAVAKPVPATSFYRTTNNPLVSETQFQTMARGSGRRGGSGGMNSQHTFNVVGSAGNVRNGGRSNNMSYLDDPSGYDMSYLDVFADATTTTANEQSYGFGQSGTYF